MTSANDETHAFYETCEVGDDANYWDEDWQFRNDPGCPHVLVGGLLCTRPAKHPGRHVAEGWQVIAFEERGL